MSNHHLRNKELPLKAKGLLSQMLSLPEDWDYTLAGLSYITLTQSAPRYGSLKKRAYITRRQGRDDKGKMTAIEYTIYEQPQQSTDTPPELNYPLLENPTRGKPTLENPTTENPTTENPVSENPMQINKEIQRTDLPKTDLLTTDLSSPHSIPIQSLNPLPLE